MATWIDFRELRNKLDFLDVLRHYNVTVKVKGRQAQGFCPLPMHEGKGRSPSFSVNLDRKCWQCFGCGAKGNVLDFAVRMEGLNPSVPADVRKTALILSEKLASAASGGRQSAVASAGKPSLPIVVNAPLDFALKELDPEHPYLRERGVSAATIEHFGLGYCQRGLLAGRVAIPLHDSEAHLIGYAGRLTKDKEISEENPKYLFPPKRERSGTVYEFHKSLFLYNGFRIQEPVNHLAVVEGFASVWWLYECGHVGSVALMGASCSETQARQIVQLVKPRGSVWVFTDGDDAGRRCALSVFLQVGAYRAVRYAPLAEGKQPTDCNADALSALLKA
jgi:DNA primase